MSNPRKIIIITTSAAQMDSGHPTGLWLEELTTPYYAFKDAGADVTIASIAGGPVPVDPRSLKPAGDNDASVERYFKDPAAIAAVAATPNFETLDADDFDAVFLPGGHGTMFDYPQSAALAKLVAKRIADDRLLAAVCHGPAGLVGAVKADGTPSIAGRTVAGFTDSEERAAGLDKAVPFLLASRLSALGAHHVGGADWAPFAVRDGNLITGQNPASAARTAELVMEALR